jgi:hypothetical protein
VTDYLDEDMKTAALEAGARDYLLKQDISALPEIVSALTTPDGGDH